MPILQKRGAEIRELQRVTEQDAPRVLAVPRGVTCTVRRCVPYRMCCYRQKLADRAVCSPRVPATDRACALRKRSAAFAMHVAEKLLVGNWSGSDQKQLLSRSGVHVTRMADED